MSVDLLLNGDGRASDDLLRAFPHDKARAGLPAFSEGSGPTAADPKRYRDLRQLLRTMGLIYDEKVDGTRFVRVTSFGKALAHWRSEGQLNHSNVRIIARHASLALSACQLRNPTSEGRRYGPDIEVFPFQFIWKAMLKLDGRITPDELNRAIYKVTNEESLAGAIEGIEKARATGNTENLGDEVITGAKKRDRILIWMGMASFGWTLIKGLRASVEGDSYEFAGPWAKQALEAAAGIKHKHRKFESEADYIEHISRWAGIPPDYRDENG